MVSERSVRAPAKINLMLQVTGRRSDGYHEIDTILQELALADTVSISFGAGTGLSIVGPRADGVPADRTNLVWDAADALAGIAGRSTDGLSMRIKKEIPAAAGLGGGSSDAAAVLQLLAEEWGLDRGDVSQAAARIGSDPPFFVRGGLARAQGRGEAITPIAGLPEHDVVLFVSAQSLQNKTSTLFKALGRFPFDNPGLVNRFLERRREALTSDDLSNSFERVAFEVFPDLKQLRSELHRSIGGPVRLAGAGPTLFWIGPVGGAPEILRLTAGAPCDRIATRTSAWRK